MKLALLSAVCLALAGAVGFLLPHAPSAPSDTVAKTEDFAAARGLLEKAKTATWQITYYSHFVSKDSKQHRWVRAAGQNQKHFFKSPGLYRVETRTEKGDVAFVWIEDAGNRAKFELFPARKTATVRYLAEAEHGSGGPFDSVLGLLKRKDLKPLGEKKVAGRKARGFRYSFWTVSHNQNWSYEVWLDAETGKLLKQQIPGGDLFRPEDEFTPARDPGPFAKTLEVDGATLTRPPGLSGGGFVLHDVELDVPLDDSLFGMKAPEGYTLKTEKLPEIKEKDVLDFMRIVAEYFGGVFPEHLPRFNQGPEYDRFEHIEHNVPSEKRTPAEDRMVKAMQRWWSTGIPGPGPMHVFLNQQIVEGSWKYLGKGVKLGDKDRVVCWYRLKDAKTYRVVHGDLSVTDVPEKELPEKGEK